MKCRNRKHKGFVSTPTIDSPHDTSVKDQTKEYEMEDEELQMADTLKDQIELEILIHALTGWTSPRTIRVAATIRS